jgi:hypothetical protein
MHSRRRLLLAPLLLSALLSTLLTACGGDKGKQGHVDGVADEALPAPRADVRGGVTGMPDKPGPGQVGLPPAAPPDTIALDENRNPVLPDALGVDGATAEGAVPELASEAAGAPAETPLADEPTPQDAIAVVRDYYAAINGRDYARAYALWSDAGRASGQSPEQFADGFDDTRGVSVEIMAPSRVDAAAGSRFIEVPVAFTATGHDGRERRFVGAYTLRRAVVDGATADQRAWRIASADLREVTQ